MKKILVVVGETKALVTTYLISFPRRDQAASTPSTIFEVGICSFEFCERNNLPSYDQIIWVDGIGEFFPIPNTRVMVNVQLFQERTFSGISTGRVFNHTTSAPLTIEGKRIDVWRVQSTTPHLDLDLSLIDQKLERLIPKPSGKNKKSDKSSAPPPKKNNQNPPNKPGRQATPVAPLSTSTPANLPPPSSNAGAKPKNPPKVESGLQKGRVSTNPPPSGRKITPVSKLQAHDRNSPVATLPINLKAKERNVTPVAQQASFSSSASQSLHDARDLAHEARQLNLSEPESVVGSRSSSRQSLTQAPLNPSNDLDILAAFALERSSAPAKIIDWTCEDEQSSADVQSLDQQEVRSLLPLTTRAKSSFAHIHDADFQSILRDVIDVFDIPTTGLQQIQIRSDLTKLSWFNCTQIPIEEVVFFSDSLSVGYEFNGPYDVNGHLLIDEALGIHYAVAN